MLYGLYEKSSSLFVCKLLNSGKHISKKVVHLLKSRPDLLASLSEVLQDVGHRSSQVGHAQLHGTPSAPPAHGNNVKSTNWSPEMDDQVIKASPELKAAGTMYHKPSEADNQEILPKAKKVGKKQDSHKSTSKVFKLGSDERRRKVLKLVILTSFSI